MLQGLELARSIANQTLGSVQSVDKVMKTIKRIQGNKYVYDGSQDIWDYLHRSKPAHWIAWRAGVIDVEYGYTHKYNNIELTN